MTSKLVTEYESNYVPTKCSSCDSNLIWKGVNLVCPNKLGCPAQVDGRLHKWIRHNGYVKGLGYKVIALVIDRLELESILDIYKLELPLSTMKSVSGIGSNTYKLIEESFELMNSPMELKDMLIGVGIQGISSSTATKLQDLTNLKSCLSNGDISELDISGASGVGPSVLRSLNENFDLLNDLYEYIDIKDTDKSEDISDSDELSKIKVALTGRLSMTRSKFLEKYSDHIVESSISESDYLITNNPGGNSSKLKKARELEIMILSEEDFLEGIGVEL